MMMSSSASTSTTCASSWAEPTLSFERPSTSILGPADAVAFAENGYWVAPVLFDAETVASAHEHAAAVCAGVHETGRAPLSAIGLGPGQLHKIDQAWWADRAIASLATSRLLGRLAAALLSVETIRLWQDQLLWKPPGGRRESVVGWHQDKGYWTASSTSNMVTAWVALGDVTADMGAVMFVPGSHRWGPVMEGNPFFETDHRSQRARARLPNGAQWREDVVELRAGQVTFHHCKTLHASRPNVSDRPRVGLAVHLTSGEARRVPKRWHPNCTYSDVRDGELWAGPDFPVLFP